MFDNLTYVIHIVRKSNNGTKDGEAPTDTNDYEIGI